MSEKLMAGRMTGGAGIAGDADAAGLRVPQVRAWLERLLQSAHLNQELNNALRNKLEPVLVYPGSAKVTEEDMEEQELCTVAASIREAVRIIDNTNSQLQQVMKGLEV